jgi:DNA adenine methylase
MQTFEKTVFSQLSKFPSTRYMGSKDKLLPELFKTFNKLEFSSALDIMSGTNSVAYLLKAMNKKVTTNDYMRMNFVIAKSLVSNNGTKLPDDIATELLKNNRTNKFIEDNFSGIYFDDADTREIQNINNNIQHLLNPSQKYLAKAALIRACIKKRPRGIFAYTGLRYNDGRKDLRQTIGEHFIHSVETINNAVFSNKLTNKALNIDSMDVNEPVDLVYIDPPYFSPLSDNEYVRRYHFVEGIARDWQGVELQEHTKTKKFKSYPSPFSKLDTTIQAFEELIKKYAKSHIVISYSSNALPKKNVILKILKKYKSNVHVKSVDYRYSFSNQGFAKDKIKNKVSEYIFVGKD